jgi:hypothetical protein
MTTALLQIAALAAVGAYLYRWGAGLRRRNARSWDSLVARLRPDWNARALTDCSFSGERLNFTLHEKWKRLQGAQGLRSIYWNAGVMLEMADYAARNSESFDRELLADLRAEAMQIRLLVLKVFAEFAVNAVDEAISINTLRAESAYAEMAVRITDLLEVNAPDALPAFVAAM